MTPEQVSHRYRPFRARQARLSVALCAIAAATALAFANDNSIFPKTDTAHPRLSTALSIGSGTVQVSFHLNIN